MELIRISDRKLKIMLTPSDMRHFEMDADRLGEDNEQTRRSFRQLMREVRRKIAFDPDDKRVSVQYFPSRGGGCEMFVSCFPAGDGRQRAPETAAALPVSAQVFAHRRETVYRMRGMNDLLLACRRLRATGFSGECAAYRDRSGGYLLSVTLVSPSPFQTPDEVAFLSEYGTVCNTARAKVYIREHATLISDRAVEQLAALV